MKRAVLLVLTLVLFLTSCYTVKFVAPPDQNIQLLKETDIAPIKIQKRAVYLLYGLIPISNTSTEEILKGYELQGLKAKTEFDIIDWLVSTLTSGLVVTKSIVIEGNPKK
ncbi:MAG: hypothetical protein N2166_05075 [candidate division WOR-3 bacterium]|nr:hypothetical protein [candidate division WOR-3 bacterium]